MFVWVKRDVTAEKIAEAVAEVLNAVIPYERDTHAQAQELRRKGVADGVAKEALAEVDTESEDRRARELIDRKLRSMAVDTADQRATAARRLVGMLARKGYGAGTAYRVVREALAEQGADADELGPGADLDD